jgi:hypothetical protein
MPDDIVGVEIMFGIAGNIDSIFYQAIIDSRFGMGVAENEHSGALIKFGYSYKLLPNNEACQYKNEKTQYKNEKVFDKFLHD